MKALANGTCWNPQDVSSAVMSYGVEKGLFGPNVPDLVGRESAEYKDSVRKLIRSLDHEPQEDAPLESEEETEVEVFGASGKAKAKSKTVKKSSTNKEVSTTAALINAMECSGTQIYMVVLLYDVSASQICAVCIVML